MSSMSQPMAERWSPRLGSLAMSWLRGSMALHKGSYLSRACTVLMDWSGSTELVHIPMLDVLVLRPELVTRGFCLSQRRTSMTQK
jgi:hypothetical protein